MSLPNLLFLCDFPPSNYAGGPVLISRLLLNYPPENMTALVSAHFVHVSPKEGQLECKHIVFPSKNWVRRWGKLKAILDRLLVIWILPIYIVWLINKTRANVVVTVAHGYFFLAAALACWMTSIPLILIVHDDWVALMRDGSAGRFYVPRCFCSNIFRFVAHRAKHIYAVSPFMQELLWNRYGVESELQMPATEPIPRNVVVNSFGVRERQDRIKIYCFGGGGAPLDVLVRSVTGGRLERYGIDCELHLYPYTSEEAVRNGWDHERIIGHGRVGQREIRAALSRADIFYLPVPFDNSYRSIYATSFPTKTSDYLVSGKPILICSPAYSGIVQYAKKYNFAEIVLELNEEAVIRGIRNICRSIAYRRQLQLNALAAFDLNHDISKQRESFERLVISLTEHRIRQSHQRSK